VAEKWIQQSRMLWKNIQEDEKTREGCQKQFSLEDEQAGVFNPTFMILTNENILLFLIVQLNVDLSKCWPTKMS
jgi:hypothetical protein